MKIFLGYPSERLAAAREVYAFLHDEFQHQVWFDKLSLIAGTDWDAERAKGQSEADLIVHLCSPEILSRAGVVNRELRQTMRMIEDQPFGALFAIFIRLSDFRLPVEFRRYQWIDHFEPTWKSQLGEAVETRVAQLTGTAHALPAPVTPPPATARTVTGSDPRVIDFEDTTAGFSCAARYLKYAGAGRYWQFVNAKITSEVLEGFFTSRHDLKDLAKDDDRAIEQDEPLYVWNISTEEFFRKEDYLSIRFYTVSYFGGAHPNHHIKTLNFLSEEFGLVNIHQLLHWEVASARSVLTFCEKVLMATFPDFDRDGDVFRNYAADDDDVWKLVSQFGVDAKGVTFNFSPYDILPYAFGEHEVLVPWHFISEFLAPEFKDLDGKLTTPRYYIPGM